MTNRGKIDVKLKLEDLNTGGEINKPFNLKLPQIAYDRMQKNDSFEIVEDTIRLNKVEDVIRYKVIYNSENKLEFGDIEITEFVNIETSELEKMKNKNDKVLVILLESPHKDEYEDNGIAKDGPALGDTGVKIKNFLLRVLEKLLIIDIKIKESMEKGENLYVVISNPIQYQTSLNMFHKIGLRDSEGIKIRNHCWNTIWKSEHIKADFKKRLTSYKPDYIINGCTYTFKKKTRLFLKENCDDTTFYETFHPCIWNKNTKINKAKF